MCSGVVVERADEHSACISPETAGGADHHGDPDDSPASTAESRMHPASIRLKTPAVNAEDGARGSAWLSELRGRDSNPDYLIQSQASYH